MAAPRARALRTLSRPTAARTSARGAIKGKGFGCTQLARWTKADNGAITLAAGAAFADRSIWQPADCPNRGTVQGQNADTKNAREEERSSLLVTREASTRTSDDDDELIKPRLRASS